jgi:Cytotoxic translational repressor of toxin-antitoxin stability system
LAWVVEVSDTAAKVIEKLGKSTQQRITRFLRELVTNGRGPRQTGKPLKRPLAGLWRYRVGDYRVVCQIEDDRFRVLVVKVGHRKDIYRR